MTTYVYETIPSGSRRKPRYFEFKQSMKAAPLTRHPETGEPIRRVMLGGMGVWPSGPASKTPASTRGSACGPSCGCH